ncbi:hypothetical protein [Haloarchaeobius sp. DYHT-AS-18]|uniref:hypothetical protein n=1 Tax=Haloarchaeobius sp. DYHT-AS-18 TaxID=3446117 RepID=UPI003EB75DEC
MANEQIVLSWIGGGIAALLLFTVVARVIDALKPENQKRTVTGVAVSAGLIYSIDLSPFGDIAVEVAHLFEVVPTGFPEWITAIVTIETVLTLILGLGVMWENGRWFAAGSFVVALFGGMALPYEPFGGVMLIGIAWMLMEASPTSRW